MPFQWENGEAETVAVALAELAFALRLQQQGQMGEAGHCVLPAKSLIEQHMERCARQPFLTTDDVGDLHQVVIDDVGQMIGRQLVGTLVEHLVVEDVALDTHITADHVVDMDLLARLHLEAYGILHTVVDELPPLLLGHGQRVAHLHACGSVVLEVLHLGTLGLELLGRVKGIVSLAGLQQLVDILLIDVAALALTVRTVASTEADTFVEFDSEPSERFQDVFLGTGNKTV